MLSTEHADTEHADTEHANLVHAGNNRDLPAADTRVEPSGLTLFVALLSLLEHIKRTLTLGRPSNGAVCSTVRFYRGSPPFRIWR